MVPINHIKLLFTLNIKSVIIFYHALCTSLFFSVQPQTLSIAPPLNKIIITLLQYDCAQILYYNELYAYVLCYILYCDIVLIVLYIYIYSIDRLYYVKNVLYYLLFGYKFCPFSESGHHLYIWTVINSYNCQNVTLAVCS